MKKSLPLTPNTKYFPLQEFLRYTASQGKKELRLTIRQINDMIQIARRGDLPSSAFIYATFWGNNQSPTHVWKRAWLSNGYIVTETRNVLRGKRTNSSSDNGVVTFKLI